MVSLRAPEERCMEWSHYSNALFDAYTGSQDNIIVQACPGAGKTTNIKHLWSLDDRPTVYLVFNKHNQLEAQGKIPSKKGSDVFTLNGLGHRAVMNTFGRIQLEPRKVLNIVKDNKDAQRKPQTMAYKVINEREVTLGRAVCNAKITALDTVMGSSEYHDMLSQYDLESYDGMLEDINTCLDINDNMTSTIDFNDQIRLPALYRCNIPQYHNVLVDECQDLNIMQAKMVSHLQGKRFVFVGDKHQSIYGFRGAMASSMHHLSTTFNCVELPLSITYRCGQSIVREAQRIYPDIEPWDSSPMGTVTRGIVVDCEKLHADYFRDPDTLILCRINSPLVCMAFGLLRDGIACHVRGRDIGNGLASLIRKLDVPTVRGLIDALEAWRELELQKALAREDERKIQSIEDKYACLQLFIGKCQLDDTPESVIDAIEDMFSQGRGLCLSTVHKAKGLEAGTAYLLQYPLHGYFAERARQDWQREQERNIEYVAVTRAKHALVYT